jgi:hypothetical protein
MPPWRTPARGPEAVKLHPVSTRSRTAALLLSSLLGGSALLAGCGGDEDPAATSTVTSAPESTGSPASTASASATDDGATDAPPFPANTDPDTAEASSDAAVTVSDIRVGRHEGFDRVVFEVGGTGTPGWDVRYVDQASSQGSGDALDVAGDAVLQVTLTGAGYPYATGVEEFTGGPVTGDTDVVTEVIWDSTFEGTSVAFVGAAAEVPFRVYQLDGPTRVVVEIAHRG